MNRKISPSKQVEVQIMDQSYTLACDENGEAALLAAVGKVDAAMCAIREGGKIRSRDRIAVLACLHLAHELIQRDAMQAAPGLSEPDAAAAAGADAVQDERLAALLARLDQALAEDDKLV